MVHNDVSKRRLLPTLREKLSTIRYILTNYYPPICLPRINLLTEFRK